MTGLTSITKEIISRESSEVATNVRKAKLSGGVMTGFQFWSDYLT
jgi:hypothetical protein